MCKQCERTAFPGKFNYSAFSEDLHLASTRSLDEVIGYSPKEIASSSRLVTSAYNELISVAGSLEDDSYRRLMIECITAPKITFLELYKGDQDRIRIFAEMVRLGLFNAEMPWTRCFHVDT